MIYLYKVKYFEIRRQLRRDRELTRCFILTPKMCIEDSDGMVTLRWKKRHRKKKQEIFWENIWSRQGTFNQESTGLNQVRKEYCKDVTTNIRDIKYQHFVKINENLKDSNSPGIDQVTGFWIKRSQCTREPTFNLFKKISYGEENIPDWLIKVRTTLVAQTHNPKKLQINRL